MPDAPPPTTKTIRLLVKRSVLEALEEISLGRMWGFWYCDADEGGEVLRRARRLARQLGARVEKWFVAALDPCTVIVAPVGTRTAVVAACTYTVVVRGDGLMCWTYHQPASPN